MDRHEDKLSINHNSHFSDIVNTLIQKLKGYRQDILYIKIIDDNNNIIDNYILRVKFSNIDIFYKDMNVIKNTDIAGVALFITKMYQK